MKETNKQQTRQLQAKVLRVFRKVHRLTGAFLFIFFFFVSISGILLGWKKHSGDLLLAKTRTGTSADQQNWLPVEALTSRAIAYVRDSMPGGLSTTIDRIDIRPNKGIAKIVFADHFQSLQIDCTTGAILNVETRRSDFLEQIHDGSIVDNVFGWEQGLFKLFYTTVLGLALLVFTVTGFWLWYGPKVMRKANK